MEFLMGKSKPLGLEPQKANGMACLRGKLKALELAN
jgi:hypothetical protein